MSEVDLSTLEARKALAAKYGAKHGIDAALVAAVIEQESSWSTWAMRYEDAFYERYVLPLNLPSITEGRARAISYGLMQLMGQVAREQGFTGKFLTELCDPDIGVDFGCAKLKGCLDKNGGDETKALLAYNGGGNTFYPAQVLVRKPTYE